MNSLLKATSLSLLILSANVSKAAQVDIEITNLTNGIWFTPLLVAAHPAGTALFEAGQPASANLQAMAEGGDISGLVTDLQGLGGTIVENPASGFLAPGMATTTSLNTDGTSNTQLSVVAMLLPTNDGFAGLNAIKIPTVPGSYVFDVPAYDAGTEANDELLTGGGAPGAAGIPGDPGGLTGTGGSGVAATDANPTVHIHRNTLGDTNPTGGASDLDSRVHRWLNPVIRVAVTVR
jgi:hypothetical protein